MSSRNIGSACGVITCIALLVNETAVRLGASLAEQNITPFSDISGLYKTYAFPSAFPKMIWLSLGCHIKGTTPAERQDEHVGESIPKPEHETREKRIGRPMILRLTCTVNLNISHVIERARREEMKLRVSLTPLYCGAGDEQRAIRRKVAANLRGNGSVSLRWQVAPSPYRPRVNSCAGPLLRRTIGIRASSPLHSASGSTNLRTSHSFSVPSVDRLASWTPSRCHRTHEMSSPCECAPRITREAFTSAYLYSCDCRCHEDVKQCCGWSISSMSLESP